MGEKSAVARERVHRPALLLALLRELVARQAPDPRAKGRGRGDGRMSALAGVLGVTPTALWRLLQPDYYGPRTRIGMDLAQRIWDVLPYPAWQQQLLEALRPEELDAEVAAHIVNLEVTAHRGRQGLRLLIGPDTRNPRVVRRLERIGQRLERRFAESEVRYWSREREWSEAEAVLFAGVAQLVEPLLAIPEHQRPPRAAILAYLHHGLEAWGELFEARGALGAARMPRNRAKRPAAASTGRG